METNFWKERWENGEIGFHQNEFSPYLEKHWNKLSIDAGTRIFVPMAGKSSDMLWFVQQGYFVTGVELSNLAVDAFFSENKLKYRVEECQRFRTHKGDQIDLHCGDFFQLTEDDISDVSAVYDRASLIALPPSLRKQYSEHLIKILPKQIRIFLVTMEYSQDEMDGPPFSVSKQEVESLYQNEFDISLLETTDILDQNQRFRERGLTTLKENVYSLVRK